MEYFEKLNRDYIEGSIKRTNFIQEIIHLKDELKHDRVNGSVGPQLMEDLELKKKYDKIGKAAEQAMPIIIKSYDKKKLRSLMDIIRRYLPKNFFKIIQHIARSDRKSKIAICFKAKMVNNLIVEEESNAKYLGRLYHDEVGLEWPEIPEGERITLKLSNLHRARAKLSRNKAPGVDLMKDEFMKSKKIF